MAKMTRELLGGYLEDSLNDDETAAIEKALLRDFLGTSPLPVESSVLRAG